MAANKNHAKETTDKMKDLILIGKPFIFLNKNANSMSFNTEVFIDFDNTVKELDKEIAHFVFTK